MKMNDAFERSIKQSLEGFEVPYNSADWAQMEQALSGSRPSSWWGSPVLYGALLAGALAVGSAAYLVSRSPEGALDTQQLANVGGASPSVPQVATGTVPATAAKTGAPGAISSEVGGSNDHANDQPVNTPESGATRSGKAAPDRTGRTEQQSATRRSATTPKGTPEAHGHEHAAAAFVASMSETCEGSAVEFSVNNMPENGIYLWNFGDGSFSNKPNPSHTFNKPGKFTVTLSMSSPGVGTIRNEPYADLIVIHEVPEASFNAVRLEYAGHVPSVHFENRSHGGARYHWDFGDGTTSTIAHPDHVYREKGIYKVTLRVSNETGCEDMMEKEVRIEKDYNLLAPTSFSPNGDGLDDHFMPQALKDLGVKFHLSIFEPKTGRLVYETSDASKPWTGKQMNTGALCARGQYVWMVEIQESLPIGDITYEGKVSLAD